ncbi:MAG: hypothetical protein HYY30_05240 [Chloroflexi bacterium]|nr:hypothetical protein [Chloroflexota bacterium]
MSTVIRAALIAFLLLTILSGIAAAQTTPVIGIDPVVGPPGTVVTYSGAGFTPNGRVVVALVRGLGLIVDERNADGTGRVTGTFTFRAPQDAAEFGFGRVEVFAIDQTTGRATLPASFLLTRGPALDYPLPNGFFFTQANGQPLGQSPTGYAVENFKPFQVVVRFADEFERLGGVARIGFPSSRTFILDGFVTQAFQKAVFQWRPERDEVFFINVFDVLHERGFDDFLLVVRSVPRQLDPSFDAGKTPQQIVASRLVLLDANPAIRTEYFAVDNPLLRYGLPTSRVEDMGNHFAIRLQRAVIQQWKVNVPWARAGQTTVANGGDIMKELEQLPAFAVVPQPPPTFSQLIVGFSPARNQPVASPISIVGDAAVFEATVSFDLVDETGNVIARGFGMTTEAGPVFGRFTSALDFVVSRQQRGFLRVYELSAADGSIRPETLVVIPVTLQL